jgi:hypothetical protein
LRLSGGFAGRRGSAGAAAGGSPDPPIDLLPWASRPIGRLAGLECATAISARAENAARKPGLMCLLALRKCGALRNVRRENARESAHEPRLREFAGIRDRGNALDSPSNDRRPLERPMKHGGRDQRSRPEPPAKAARRFRATRRASTACRSRSFPACGSRREDKMAGHRVPNDELWRVGRGAPAAKMAAFAGSDRPRTSGQWGSNHEPVRIRPNQAQFRSGFGARDRSIGRAAIGLFAASGAQSAPAASPNGSDCRITF